MKHYMKKLGAITLLILLLTTNPVYATRQDGLESQNLPAPLAAPYDPSKIVFQQVASGLANPVFITNAGDGSGRIFIVEREGRIRILKNGVLMATPFLDIRSSVKSTSGEQGLLSLAFHPSYASNGTFFVVYTANRSGDLSGSKLILKRFTVSSNSNVANPNSGVILLAIQHPGQSNHNGGTLAFGQDGYLYWSTGDGGGGGDPNNNGQNLNSLLGKMLRIDVNTGSPYGIPTSNPFFSNPSTSIKKEIWAYGLRNPWHFSFDSLTHDLYIGDVGQQIQEEINFQPAASTGGENYGWRIMEGVLCYNPSSGCDQSGITLPVANYAHNPECSVTGGYVYRGNTFADLYGHYFYADFCSGRLFSIYRNSTPGWDTVQSIDTPYQITTFGEDEQKELYFSDYSSGKIYRIGYQNTPPVTLTLNSNGVADGWILESSQTSNAGGSKNGLVSLINVGDNPANKQYRGILDFDTAALPDTAIITSAVLRIKKSVINGVDPFTTHGRLRADIQTAYFGTGPQLEVLDFQATPSRSQVAIFNPTPVDNWYSANINYPGITRISSTLSTQFRLRFTLADNANKRTDQIRFFSGDADPSNQPQLIIQYYVP